MYIFGTETFYDRHGQQHCKRAPFLILVQPFRWEDRNKPIRALVRQVALSQCGHWMIGKARIANQTISVSGSYGNDGLPKAVPQEIYDLAIDVPKDLIEAWSKGGGWNSAGSEAPLFAEWAKETFECGRNKKQKGEM